MKKVAALVLVLGFASSAFAGTVTFTPLGSDEVLVGVGGSVQFEVSVEAGSLESWNLTNLLLGSNDLTVTSFSYAESWIALQGQDLADPGPAFIYPSDIFIGGFLGSPSTTGLLVGVLTVDAGAHLALGDYTVIVDSSQDFGISIIKLDFEGESLLGSGTVHVTPEPATLILLGIGGIAAMRRRRR